MKTLKMMILCLFVTTILQAQVNYQPKTIKVKGNALKEIEPNEIHLVVHLKEVTERNVQVPIVVARDNFMRICKDAGVANADIDMSFMRSQLIQQKINFWRRAQTALAMHETYDITFTDMDKLLTVIEKLDQPYVESINFGEQTHTEITKFRKEVKEEAAKAAIEKATYLANASGQEVGKVIFIEEVAENYLSQGSPYTNSISYTKKSESARVNFGFKPIQLQYEVLVICELK